MEMKVPTGVGVNRSNVLALSAVPFKVPTGVGVNRYHPPKQAEAEQSPHRRGGEPALSQRAKPQQAKSPQAWG